MDFWWRTANAPHPSLQRARRALFTAVAPILLNSVRGVAGVANVLRPRIARARSSAVVPTEIWWQRRNVHHGASRLRQRARRRLGIIRKRGQHGRRPVRLMRRVHGDMIAAVPTGQSWRIASAPRAAFRCLKAKTRPFTRVVAIIGNPALGLAGIPAALPARFVRGR